MQITFKAQAHNLKYRSVQLVPTTVDNEAKDVIKQAKRLSTLLKKELDNDEIPVGRLVFDAILRKMAMKTRSELPFTDESIQQVADKVKRDLDINIDYIVAHPEFLDVLYENLVAASYRKKYGQFLTPDYVAEFMASWVIQDKPSGVFDPAVGTGIFLDKVVQIAQSSPIELWGYDIDPVLLNACKLRLKLRNIESDSLRLGKQDFLEVGFFTKKFDSIICNPPYLNFHDFDRNHLVRIVETRYGTRLSRLTNIYALFFMQSLLFAKKGARIAFITPSEFLYTGYGEELKSFFLEYTTLDALVLVDFEALVFDKALTTAVITLFRRGHPSTGHKVKFIRVFKWSTTAEMLNVVDKGIENPKKYRIRQIPQSELDPRQKWLEYFESNKLGSVLSKLVPLSHIADISRGIATGHNDYFRLSDSEIEKWGIEEHFITPVISKTVQCEGYEFKSEDWRRLKKRNEKAFLLYCFDEPTQNLRKYIEHGEELEVNQRYLTRHRKPWYSMERRRPAKILAMVFHRKMMRFILNSANVRNLTAFHCVYPKFDNITMIKALLAYLNSDLCKEIQVIKRREYGGGLHKFEPKDLENIPTLDVTCLDKNELEFLASMFDKLSFTSRRREDETQIQKLLNDFLKSVISTM